MAGDLWDIRRSFISQEFNMAKDVLPEIAQRYQVPEHVVRELYRQLESNGGTQCQFACPELAGQIQWMPGMVMVSRPTDTALKARGDGLCCELAAVLSGSDTAAPGAIVREWEHQSAVGESWWPATFGHPTTSGEQNGVRYAYFPDQRRLLLQQGARIDTYDTTGHHITGAAQQQGHGSSLTFSTDRGPISTKQLKCIPMS
jgi:hypothetical protein